MASQDVSIPLMDKNTEDDYCNAAFDFYDDSSSGYDSTDLSDTESSASDDSRDSARDSYVNLLPASPSNKEIMNFQSTQALCENLKLILAMPDMCDVTFLVGPRKIPVHGVRAIMGTRSRVLYQLILRYMDTQQFANKKTKKTKEPKAFGISRTFSERLVIPVKKYDSEVFRMLIQFVHCGTVNITEETVAGLFCGAKQFDLPDLAKACLDFVERCIRHNRTDEILSSARTYSHFKATEIIFDKIYSVLDKRYYESRKQTAV